MRTLRKERPQIDLTLHLKKLEEEAQAEAEASGMEEIINRRAELENWRPEREQKESTKLRRLLKSWVKSGHACACL